jgi:transcription initiation factor TFIIIB Brf1 subunit/transcription initiation factor TFIIB
MEIKKDMEQMAKKYHPAVKKTGEQFARAVREAEDEIARMYKIAQAQVEIQMTNLKKEKMYHTIGKEVAGMILRGELEIPVFDKYISELKTLDGKAHKSKNAIIAVGRAKNKKKKAGKGS